MTSLEGLVAVLIIALTIAICYGISSIDKPKSQKAKHNRKELELWEQPRELDAWEK